MKRLFENKVWMAVQVFFFTIGVIGALLFEKDWGIKMGAVAAAFNVISIPNNLAPAIFLIIFSALAFNVEFLQGTFMTHVFTRVGKKSERMVFEEILDFHIFHSDSILSFRILHRIWGFRCNLAQRYPGKCQTSQRKQRIFHGFNEKRLD